MCFTVQLLIVLLVFYVLGGIIKLVLDRFMGKFEEKKEDKAEAEEEKKETEEPEADAENSENEEET